MDKIYEVVRHVLATNYDDLSKQVVEGAKQCFIDTIGVILAGSSALGCRELVEQVKYWGGREESTILVHGGKVPSFLAAFANSMMAHARDFDDDHEEGGVHPSASVVPTGIAVAEQLEGVDGKKFITAIAIGIDLVCRLGLSVRILQGWHLSGICGGIGSVATAGKLLGLGEDQLWNAFGIAYAQTTGNTQGRRDGAMTKRMNPGFASKAAVLSAYLAKRGITGPKNIMEGKEGFFNMFDGGSYFEPEKLRSKIDGSPYNHNELTKDLGEVFKVEEMSFKPFPCCRFLHAPIDATLKNVQRNNIQPEDVEEVTVRVCKRAVNNFGHPFETRDTAQIDAQFNIPYGVASAILRRQVGLKDFEDVAVRDPRILEITKKIRVVENPQAHLKVPVIVEIKTKNGKIYTSHVEEVIGGPKQPMTREEFLRKFNDCARYAARPISSKKLEDFLFLADRLETLSDIREVINLLI